jgi:hypothetical protein
LGVVENASGAAFKPVQDRFFLARACGPMYFQEKLVLFRNI